MPEINLLQSRTKETHYAWRNQANLFLIVLVVLVILVAGMGGGLMVLNKKTQSQIDEYTKKNTEIQTNLDNKQKNLGSAKQFQAQLSNLRTLLNQHVYMTSVLKEIEKVTHTKAKYETIDVTNEGAIQFQGETTDYNSLAKLIMGLNSSTKFSEVKLLSVSPSSGENNTYAFNIELKAATELFVTK